MSRKRARAARRAARRSRATVAAAAVVAGVAALPAAAEADTFTVTNNADSGAGSLRKAISDANAMADSDTIQFASSVVSPITLTGRIPIIKSVTIVGPGASAMKVVAPTDNALFVNDTMSSGITVDIGGLTLEGHSSGAGSAGGGLIAGSGKETIVRNSVISGGTAANKGGGIYVEDTNLTVIDSQITGNTATGAPGGGIYGRNANVAISGSTISGNKGSFGGGIQMRNDTGGHATSLSIAGSSISGNQAVSGGSGGIGVRSADGDISIVNSTVSGNQAAQSGGGAYFGYVSNLAISSSTFSGNNAGKGAGFFVQAPTGTTTLSDSTVTGNTAGDIGGGIYSYGYYDKPVTFQNSTIAGNTAVTAGGGIARQGVDGIGPGYEGADEINLASTIVANNTAPTGKDLADGPTATPNGGFRALSSLLGSTSGANVTEITPDTNKLNTGPITLGPLADNGGPTKTLLPPDDSPVIDAGAANGLALDQRGLSRAVIQPGTKPQADGTDIGAVELQDDTVDGAKLKVKKKQKEKGKKVVIKVKASAAESVTVFGSGSVKLGKKKLKLTKPKLTLNDGKQGTLKLKVKGKKPTKKVLGALASGKKVKAAISVDFDDFHLNTVTQTAKVTLKGA